MSIDKNMAIENLGLSPISATPPPPPPPPPNPNPSV